VLPQLAAFLTVMGIAFLLLYEKRVGRSLPISQWVPLVWFLVLSSRFPGQWIRLGTPVDPMAIYSEGSPIDRVFFLVLIIIGFFILFRRRLVLGELLRANWWVFVFFLYCGVSLLWSDFGFIGFKRWIKEIGNLIMVLIIVTDSQGEERFKSIFRHYMYILIPLSVLFIRYFPQIGRAYHPWTGEIQLVGVGLNKNYLGFLCLVCGFFLLWLFFTRKKREGIKTRSDTFILTGFGVLVSWLVLTARSATALICLIIGAVLLFFLNMPVAKRNARSLGFLAVLLIAVYGFFQITADITGFIIESLGRDPTLTDRMPLWKDLLRMDINPLLGTGYDTFWLGERLETLWASRWWHPNQAHSGYIETYLNLGIVGVMLIGILVWSAYRKNRFELESDRTFGSFGLAYLPVFLLYNVTEAAFKGPHPIWLLFLLCAVKSPGFDTLKIPKGKHSLSS